MFTVLIADDESIERNYLTAVFQRQSKRYQVVAQAENGIQATELAAFHRPDIAILDINMPLLSGLNAAKRIRESGAARIIILNSAYAEFEFARQAIEYGLDGYLLKPAQEQEIFATIETCLHRKRLDNSPASARPLQRRERYPIAVVDRLIEAIDGDDLSALKSNATLYLDFLKSLQGEAEQYRLHVINTLFCIEQALCRRSIPDNLLTLLDCSRFLQEIGKAPSWQAIRSSAENFFTRLLLLFEGRGRVQEDEVETVARHIDRNYAEPLPLDDLAELVKFNPAYLSRLFHEKKGMTIRTYVNRKRIEQAVHLLQKSDRKIRDIAGDCGFGNISHFHRVFKEYTGKTPAESRKEATA